MLIAKGDEKDGGQLLIVGLQEENMRKLANDEPIYKSLDGIVPGLEGWTLTILGPEDTARFVAHFGKGGENDGGTGRDQDDSER